MRVVARCVTAVVTVLTAVVLGGGSAQAASQIGVSRDGSTWSSSITVPLFSPSERWVPGDADTATFYVRNQASDPGVLTLSATTDDMDRLLADGDIDLRARAAGGAWISLDHGLDDARLRKALLSGGSMVKVEVGATFVAASTNPSQRKSVSFGLRVTLSQDTSGSGGHDTQGSGSGNGAGSGSSSGSGSGLLPNTGGPAFWILVGGVVCVAGGIVLVALRRREEDR